MRKLLTILLVFTSYCSIAQINPNNGTVSNKSYSPAQAVSTDFRSWFYDGANFIMRDYNGTAEVISYLNLSKYRSGHFPIYVHSGGSLGSNGVWTGGVTLIYWFKDGVADGNLVRWYTDSVITTPKVDTVYRKNDSTIGLTINQGPERTFIIRGTAAGGISSLVLNAPSSLFGTPVNFSNAAGAWTGSLVIANQNPNYVFAGPSSGGPAAPAWRALVPADLPTGIPNGNLQNSSIAFAVGSSGSAPNWTSSPVSLGGTATFNLPITSSVNTGIVNPTQYNFWTGKVDSTVMSNDSVYEWRNGTRFFRYVIVGGGSVTSVAATVPSSLLTISGSPITGAGTLAFGLATQSANVAFGNFTGSTATPTFGKLPLAVMATGPANFLVGYDGSGNPVALQPDTLFHRQLGVAGDSVTYLVGDTLKSRLVRDSLGFHHVTNTDGSWTMYATGGFTDPLTTNGDIIARIAGTTTRLPQGGNGTFLGVSGGALGYYTPAGTTNDSGIVSGLAVSVNRLASNFRRVNTDTSVLATFYPRRSDSTISFVTPTQLAAKDTADIVGYGHTITRAGNVRTHKADTTNGGSNSLKSAFLPLRLDAAKTIFQNNNSITFAGGGRVNYDSLMFVSSLLLSPGTSGATGVFYTGDSFTFGLAASPITKAYPYLLSGYLGINTIDSGVSSTTFPAIGGMVARNITYPNPYIVSIMGGFNNFRNTNILTIPNRPTLQMCLQSYKFDFLKANCKAVQNATSGTGVTRPAGTWNTGYNCVTNANGITTTGAYTSSAGATIQYVATDSTFIVFMEVPKSSSTNLTVSVDGSVVQTLNPSNQSDQSYGHYSIIITGLSNASHTILLTNVSGGLMIVDGFSSFIPAATALATFMWEVPKMNSTGYAGGQFSDAAADLFNAALDSMALTLPPGYPNYIMKSNSTYNVHTGGAADSIHPGNTGHIQLEQAGINALNASSPMSDGTIFTRKNVAGTTVGYYGQTSGIQGRFPFINEIGLQTVINNNQNIAGDFTVQSATNNTFGWEGFGNFDIDSVFSVNKTTSITTMGQITTKGAAAGVNFYSRDGNMATGWTQYAQSLKLRLFSGEIGSDVRTVDTAFHNLFYAEKNQSGAFAAKSHATISIMGNYFGTAGHAPLKIYPGIPIKERLAWEVLPGGQYIIFTDSTGVTDTLALRGFVRSLSGGGGSSQPFSTATALSKDNTDATKLLNFNISGFTTGTTRTWVWPNVNGTIARSDAAQTFTGVQTFSSAPILSSVSTATSNYSFVVRDSSTGEIKHVAPATLNLYAANGATLTSTDTINAFTGALNQISAVAGAGFPLSLGTSGSNLGQFNIYSPSIFLRGSTSFAGGNPTNANLTVGDEGMLYLLPNISANRTITLPSVSNYFCRILVFANNNTTTAFNWSFSSSVANPGGSPITTLQNGATYILQSHGSNGWTIISKSDGAMAPIETGVATFNLGVASQISYDYIFTGSTTTWTLPDMAGSIGKRIYIKNAGSGNITLNTAGSDLIYDTSSGSSITIAPGASRIIVASASSWYVE
jgi:hypothetical protein